MVARQFHPSMRILTMDKNLTKEMVIDSLTTVLMDMWYKENPHRDPVTYRFDFQLFCEEHLTSMMVKKNG